MNCPEYIGILIGTSKIRVQFALINYNLREKGLLHCINIAECSGIIYENTLEDALNTMYDQLDEKIQGMCFCCLGNPVSIGRSFDSEVKERSSEVLPFLKEQSISGIVYSSQTHALQ